MTDPGDEEDGKSQMDDFEEEKDDALLGQCQSSDDEEDDEDAEEERDTDRGKGKSDAESKIGRILRKESLERTHEDGYLIFIE